jgi:hypothetical protein
VAAVDTDFHFGKAAMSFVTAVRDYVDFINQSYDSMSTHGSLLFYSSIPCFTFLKVVNTVFLSAEPSMADRPLFLTNFGAIDVGGDPPRNFYPREPAFERLPSSRVTFLLENKFLLGFKQPSFSSNVGDSPPCWKTALSGRHPSWAGSRVGKHHWPSLLPFCLVGG